MKLKNYKLKRTKERSGVRISEIHSLEYVFELINSGQRPNYNLITLIMKLKDDREAWPPKPLASLRTAAGLGRAPQAAIVGLGAERLTSPA
jgi:hypothetical protein